MFENVKTGAALWDVTIFKSDMSPEIFPIRCDAARSAWTPLSLVLRMYVWYFLRMWHYLLSECAIANSYLFFCPSLWRICLLLAYSKFIFFFLLFCFFFLWTILFAFVFGQEYFRISTLTLWVLSYESSIMLIQLL